MNISLVEFIKTMKHFEGEVIEKIHSDELTLEAIPDFLITPIVAINAIVKDVSNFKSLSISKLDKLVCLAACQVEHGLLMEIPPERSAWVSSRINDPFLSFLKDEQKNDFLTLKFIEKNSENIKYAVSSFKSNRELLEKSCLSNPYILLNLPDGVLDLELCELALTSKDFSLKCLPESWCTKDFCYKAFQRSYKEIVNFPKEFISYYYVSEALNLCLPEEVVAIMSLIGVQQWDNELIIKGIKKSESVISALPFDRVTADLIFLAAPYIKKYETLHHVPESEFSENLNNVLIKENPMLLGGIPLAGRNRALCFEAISANGMALAHAPQITQTEEMWRLAVTQNGIALKFVPTPYRDAEIPMLAIQQNGEAIQYLPDHMQNEVICRLAVNQNPKAIYYIPKKSVTNELFNIAINDIPETLQLIPVDERTTKQCIIAIKQDASLYNYVPKHVLDDSAFQKVAIKLGLMKVDDV